MGRSTLAGTHSRKSNASASALSKNLKCSECAKDFSRKGDLKRHELLHTGVKNHECPQCNKRFSQNSGLKTHMNVHTGHKPYRCAFAGCGAEFGDPSSHARHKKETHLVDYRYECPYERCNSAIKRRSAFAQHLSKKHNKIASSEELDEMKKSLCSPIQHRNKLRQSTLTHTVTSTSTTPSYKADMVYNGSNSFPKDVPYSSLKTGSPPARDLLSLETKPGTEYMYPNFSHRDITQPLSLPAWSSSTASSFSTQSSTETLVDEMINFVDTKAYYSDMTGPVQIGMIHSSNHSPSPSGSPFVESDIHYTSAPLAFQDLQRMNSVLAYDRQRYIALGDQSCLAFRCDEDTYSSFHKVVDYSTPDILPASPSATQQNLTQQWGSWGFVL